MHTVSDSQAWPQCLQAWQLSAGLSAAFQLRHTATRTYHVTQNTSSTQSSGANRHAFLDTASYILLAQTIYSTLPIHLSHLPTILPHVRITTHGRTGLKRTGKHLLRSNSWQRNPSTLMLHRQRPLCPVKTRVGSDKPRKAKHYIESQVKHNEGYTSTPFTTRHQARNLTQRIQFFTIGKTNMHSSRRNPPTQRLSQS